MLTPDGCPVEAYAVLPAEPEISVVRRHAAGRHGVLDLGAGTGRIADPLAIDGHDVLAVDESAAMLAHVRHARSMVARIDELDVGERFDLVLLLSHLVNEPDRRHRLALLRAAAGHLAEDGLLLIQRHDPSRPLRAGAVRRGEVEVALTEVDTARWPLVGAVTRYRLGDQAWDQPWTAEILDDPAIADVLDAAGLTMLTADGAWVTATTN